MSEVVRVGLAVVLRRRAGRWRVLVSRRRAGGVLGGFWELPGGKIEPGESPEQGLLRELREEVGLAGAVERALEPVEHAYDHGRVRLLPFVCRVEGGGAGAEARAIEAAEVRWLGAGDLATYRFPPANAELMRWIEGELRRRDAAHAEQEATP